MKFHPKDYYDKVDEHQEYQERKVNIVVPNLIQIYIQMKIQKEQSKD